MTTTSEPLASKPEDESFTPVPPLTRAGRYIVLAAAFLGWMLAGLEMAMYLSAPYAAQSYLASNSAKAQPSDITAPATDAQAPPVTKTEQKVDGVGWWVSQYLAAFLLGAGVGGLPFGWLGDRIGRSKVMGISIIWYSIFTGVSYWADGLDSLLVLRFIAAMGVGGMWPTGVALASEAWSDASRPLMAGLIGAAANVGLSLMGAIAQFKKITLDDWRWVFLVGATPVFLGIFVLLFVPESPLWQNRRRRPAAKSIPISVVFRPPYLKLTLIGIVLGAIPLLGGWGCLNWLMVWSKDFEKAHPGIYAQTQFLRSFGAVFGSLLGGWLANLFGRRSTYFAVSFASLLISGYIFWFLTPDSPSYLYWVFTIGFVATIAFGWLPLYLPELFPTEVRATGSGVTFNYGRFIAAAGTLGTGTLTSYFDENYAHVGRVTHLIFAVGMIVILFAPDTSTKRMED